MLTRILEPEVMDTIDEARDYDAMDHRLVNDAFCDDFARTIAPERHAGAIRILDVGTGTARIPIGLCARLAKASVVAIDMAQEMLAIARENVKRAALATRIELEARDAKQTHWPAGQFDAVVSNTIVHHIPEPIDVLAEMWRLVRDGGVLFVRDLVRPENTAHLAQLVALHGGAPETNEAADVARHARQRALFEASLAASCSLEEVRAFAARLMIDADAVVMTSDRHWTLAAIKSGKSGTTIATSTSVTS